MYVFDGTSTFTWVEERLFRRPFTAANPARIDHDEFARKW
jgi:hypothetical protein